MSENQMNTEPEVTDYNPETENPEFASVSELKGESESNPEMTEETQQSEPEQKGVESEQLAITVYDPAEVNVDDFDFTADLDALEEQVVKRAERILSVDHPDGDGKTHFLLRALTPTEEASLNLNENLLSVEYMQMIVETLLKKVEEGGKIDNTGLTEMIVEKMAVDDVKEASNQRFLKRIQMGIELPKGITIERLERWNPALLERFFDIIETLTYENEKWITRNGQ